MFEKEPSKQLLRQFGKGWQPDRGDQKMTFQWEESRVGETAFDSKKVKAIFSGENVEKQSGCCSSSPIQPA